MPRNDATLMRPGEAYIGPRRDQEVYSCRKCKGQYFEAVQVNKYITGTMVLGQMPAATGPSFVLLRCIHCSELHEPRLHLSTIDAVTKEYESFTRSFEADAKAGG